VQTLGTPAFHTQQKDLEEDARIVIEMMKEI